MTGILSLHDIDGMGDTITDDHLVVGVDEARMNFLFWLNDPGSADEWPYREPVVGEDATPEDDELIRDVRPWLKGR